MPWTKISMQKADRARSVEARLVRLILSRRTCAGGCGKSWQDNTMGCWVYHAPGQKLAWRCDGCEDEEVPLLCLA